MGYEGDKKREYQRQWMQNRRAAAIEYLGGKCLRCHSVEDLEFDHTSRKLKSKNISALLSYKWETLKEELDKCQLLCNSCHISKTVTEIPEWLGEATHGTHSMYSGRGCRCIPCKGAHAELAREYRAAGKKW